MAKILYSLEQVQELSNSPYVEKCSDRYIVFTKEYKIEFLRLSEQWIFYREIFKLLWFPKYIVESKVPERSYNRWKKNMRNGTLESKKWRKKKGNTDFSKMTPEEQVKYLQAENAYLKELHKTIYWHYP